MLHTAGVLGRCLGRDTQTNQAVRQQAVTLIHALRRRAARLCQTDEAVPVHRDVFRTAQKAHGPAHTGLCKPQLCGDVNAAYRPFFILEHQDRLQIIFTRFKRTHFSSLLSVLFWGMRPVEPGPCNKNRL